MKPRVLLLNPTAVAAVMALALGGCGSGSSPSRPDGPRDDDGQTSTAASDGNMSVPDLDGGSDAAGPDGGAAACLGFEAGVGAPTGAKLELSPGKTLQSVLATAQPGDRVQVHGGTYPKESFTRAFAQDVFIEAAAGETPLFHGLKLTNSSHLVLRGLNFDATVTLQSSHEMTLDGVHIDVGALDISGLELSDAGGATHDVRVLRSRVAGGARTIFMAGVFGPSTGWNHHLEFRQNEFICGSHNCFQLSGARDVVIEDNDFHDPRGGGVLLAGATRVVIARNRMRGTKSVKTSAIQLATPGVEWDNYAGVEHMLSTDISVENNLIVSWGDVGIELDAVDDVRIVYNTIADGSGLRTWRRSPHDQQGNVIITGNNHLKVWNNILPSIQLDKGDARPTFEASNLVESGGGGTNLVTGAAKYQDAVDYAPRPDSPGVGQAVVTPETPRTDRRGRPRGAMPDIGAFEHAAPECR